MCVASPHNTGQLRCGSFITTRERLPPPLVFVSPGTLLLRAVSCGSCSRSKSDTYRRPCHVAPALLPFFWPSRRRKSYFHQVKAMRHETDGGLNNATRYRRSCSDTKQSPLPGRMIMFHPRNKTPSIRMETGHTKKYSRRKMPPAMMEPPPLPGIPTAVPTEPCCAYCDYCTYYIYSRSSTYCCCLYVSGIYYFSTAEVLICTYVLRKIRRIRTAVSTY